MKKYYQLIERAGTNNLIGVVLCMEGHFNKYHVKEALVSHFDSDISNIMLDEENLEISFNLDDRDERETVDLVQTWLYV